MRTAERAAEGTCGSFPRLFWCEARGSGQAGARHWQPLHILQVGVLASSLACALLAGLLPSYWRVKEHPHSGPQARTDPIRVGQAKLSFNLFGEHMLGPSGEAVWQLTRPMRLLNEAGIFSTCCRSAESAGCLSLVISLSP